MNKIRILIVEDHPLVRNGIRGMLQTETDMEVVGEAANGSEALSLIIEHEPAIILSDLKMPVLDGLEMLPRLPPHYRKKVLMLTMTDHQQYVVKAFSNGVSGYLLKGVCKESYCSRSVTSIPIAGIFVLNWLYVLLNNRLIKMKQIDHIHKINFNPL